MIEEELNTVGKYADLITSVSDDYCKRLKNLHKKNVIKVTNGFDIDENIVKKNLKNNKKKINKTLNIVYTGSIYTNESSPVMLLDAIINLYNKNKIPKIQLRLNFMEID